MVNEENEVSDGITLLVLLVLLIFFWILVTFIIWLCSSTNVSIVQVFSNQLYHITHIF